MSIVTITDDSDKRYKYLVDKTLPPIGKGGMGTVFRGVRIDTHNPDEKRPIAIKFLHDNIEGSEQIILREQRTANLKIEHENVLEMMGFVTMTVTVDGHPKKRYFVISELLDGVNLLNLVKGFTNDLNGQPYDYARMMLQRFRLNRTLFVTEIVENVLKGLKAIHDVGYIHRDIDPSNIILTTDGKIKIIDFGISKNIKSVNPWDVAATQAGGGMGKPVYSSPEVLSGDLNAQNASSDLYSVGIMIYALAVGHLPYSGTQTEILKQKMTHKLPVEDISDPTLRHIARKATDNNQAKRYNNASQFLADIGIRKSAGISEWLRRMPVLAWIGIAAVMAAVIVVIILI